MVLPWAPVYAILFMWKLECEFLETQAKLRGVWWRYMDPWWTNLTCTYLHRKHLLSSPFCQIYCILVSRRSHFSGQKSLPKRTAESGLIYMSNLRTGTNFSAWTAATPKHCKTAIPYSQVLRLRRTYSEDLDLVKRLRNLEKYLLKCRYNREHLNFEL